jgi:hypothetical protein
VRVTLLCLPQYSTSTSGLSRLPTVNTQEAGQEEQSQQPSQDLSKDAKCKALSLSENATEAEELRVGSERARLNYPI